MAQHDYVISNDTGANVRADINNVLQAILTNNAGATQPSATQPGMFWGDISNASTYYLKIRNHTNDGWVSLYAYDVATKTISPVNTPAGNISSTTVQGAINELDTEKQATLVSGTNIKTVNSASLLGSGDIPIYTGFKNYIINGKKIVNKRGLTSTDNSYNQDRWYKAGNNWYQGIEGDSNLISGKTYTLSWIGSATAGYYVGTATSATINSQSFTTIANGSSFTLTISAGQNLWIKFSSDATGSTFNFVQFEEGSVATPFEQRPYGLELSLCQRYYEKKVLSTEPKPATYWTGNGGVFESVIQFNVEKRVIPTLSVTGIPQWSVNEGTWTNTSNPTYTASASVHSFNLRAGNFSTMPQVAGAIRLNGDVVASAEL